MCRSIRSVLSRHRPFSGGQPRRRNKGGRQAFATHWLSLNGPSLRKKAAEIQKNPYSGALTVSDHLPPHVALRPFPRFPRPPLRAPPPPNAKLRATPLWPPLNRPPSRVGGEGAFARKHVYPCLAAPPRFRFPTASSAIRQRPTSPSARRQPFNTLAKLHARALPPTLEYVVISHHQVPIPSWIRKP